MAIPQPVTRILMQDSKVPSELIGNALGKAFQASRQPIDIHALRARLDPKGAAPLDSPTDSERELQREWLGKHYAGGKNFACIENANYNPFNLQAMDVMIDLLTDSGTSNPLPMQDLLNPESLMTRWLAEVPMQYTNAYAGSEARLQLDRAIAEVFGGQFAYAIGEGNRNEESNFAFNLATQGRSAERLALIGMKAAGLISQGDVILSNRPFDTTKGHIEAQGLKVMSLTPLTTPQSYENRETEFLGNVPLDARDAACSEHKGKIKVELITTTDNGGGGQPVSMENIRKVSESAHEQGHVVWIDACRIFENALFIKTYEKGYSSKGLDEIVREMLSYSDIVTISFKKMYSDCGGGVLFNRNSPILAGKTGEAMRAVADEDKKESEKTGAARSAIRMQTTVDYGNGFDSYCGLTGLGIVRVISGILTAMDPEVVGDRIAQVNDAYKTLRSYGVPVVGGGHALYFAADQMLPGVKDTACAAELLQAMNYAAFGMRGCGLGNIVYGKWKIGEGGIYSLESKPEMDSMRYAIPRFVYSNAFLNSVLKLMGKAYQDGYYEGIAHGLYPQAFESNGFYHFGGAYLLENPDQSGKSVGKSIGLVRGVLDI